MPPKSPPGFTGAAGSAPTPGENVPASDSPVTAAGDPFQGGADPWGVRAEAAAAAQGRARSVEPRPETTPTRPTFSRGKWRNADGAPEPLAASSAAASTGKSPQVAASPGRKAAVFSLGTPEEVD